MPKPFQVQDKYFHKAKEAGYRARSAFKLLDIQRKFNLIKKADHVLDIGAAPGSFLQVLAEIVGEEGRVFGVDLQEIEPLGLPHVKVATMDVFDFPRMKSFLEYFKVEKLDLITSDLAPKTSGIKDVDQFRSSELTEAAFRVAQAFLKPGGHFVAKVFEGEDLYHLQQKIKAHFKKTTLFKPPSCRDRSVETYLIGLNFTPKP